MTPPPKGEDGWGSARLLPTYATHRKRALCPANAPWLQKTASPASPLPFDRAPDIAAAIAFLAGAATVISIAAPGLRHIAGLDLLSRFTEELPELSASIGGVALMGLAPGLRRRVDTAWAGAVALLAAAALYAFFRHEHLPGALVAATSAGSSPLYVPPSTDIRVSPSSRPACAWRRRWRQRWRWGSSPLCSGPRAGLALPKRHGGACWSTSARPRWAHCRRRCRGFRRVVGVALFDRAPTRVPCTARGRRSRAPKRSSQPPKKAAPTHTLRSLATRASCSPMARSSWRRAAAFH